jgi:hypothetical protein
MAFAGRTKRQNQINKNKSAKRHYTEKESMQMKMRCKLARGVKPKRHKAKELKTKLEACLLAEGETWILL